MASLAALDDLPPGFAVRETERGILAVRSDLAGPFQGQGFGPEDGGSLPESGLAGRRPLEQLEHAGRRYVVRRFAHGGLLRWLTGKRFLDPGRPFRELILSHRLRELGLPTPEVVAARSRPARAGGWLLDLVSERVEDAVDLGLLLEELAEGRVERRRLAPILVAAGRLVGDLHRAGLAHADLNARNFLVERAALEGAGPELWILDLDRSVLRESLGPRERLRNLRRLFRFVARRRPVAPRSGLTRSDLARFLRAYDPAPGNWKQSWRAIQRAHARHGPAHSVGWALERGFGAQRPG